MCHLHNYKVLKSRSSAGFWFQLPFGDTDSENYRTTKISLDRWKKTHHNQWKRGFRVTVWVKFRIRIMIRFRFRIRVTTRVRFRVRVRFRIRVRIRVRVLPVSGWILG